MTIKISLLLVLIQLQITAFCQTYEVSMDDRNKTIDLTNSAINEIKENKIENAILLLKEAIKIDSTFRPSFINLYKAHVINKTLNDELIAYLKKGIRIFEEDDELHFYLGETYKAKNNTQKALIEYNNAITFSKKNGETYSLVPSYYSNRGNLYLKINDFESALKDYNYALNLRPDHGPTLLNRGICFYKKGDVENACINWNRALELGFSQSSEYIQKYCNKNSGLTK